MLNTTAPLFADDVLSKDMERQEAELYSKLYALAAEDFTTIPDILRYIQSNKMVLLAMQKQLTMLFQLISTHAHRIPPHYHPIPPHTHPDPTSGTTGPNTTGLATTGVSLVTQIPTNSSSIKWNTIKVAEYVNTSNAIPNMAGNTVIIGSSQIGPLRVGKRRAKVPLILASPTVLPILKGLEGLEKL